MPYIVIGAGGHAKVVIEILKAMNAEIEGIVDDYYTNSFFFGYPVLGKVYEQNWVSKFHAKPDVKCIIAIGNADHRKRAVEQITGQGLSFGIAIHPSAIISSSAVIGQGTVVMANAVVNAFTYIGSHVILNTACTVDHDCQIEDFVHISPGVNLAGGISIGQAAHIGIGSSVIQGVAIGSQSIIGAGACVVNNIPADVVAVGCPAKILKSLNERGE
jgi:acetyltransferase EpsM